MPRIIQRLRPGIKRQFPYSELASAVCAATAVFGLPGRATNGFAGSVG